MFHSNIFIYVNAILLSFVLAKSLLNVFTQQRLCHMFHFRNSNRRSFTLLLASTGERYMNPFHLDNFVIWIFRTKANTKTKVEMYCVTSDLLLRLEIARVAIFGWLYCIYSVYTHRTKCVCVFASFFWSDCFWANAWAHTHSKWQYSGTKMRFKHILDSIVKYSPKQCRAAGEKTKRQNEGKNCSRGT